MKNPQLVTHRKLLANFLPCIYPTPTTFFVRHKLCIRGGCHGDPNRWLQHSCHSSHEHYMHSQTTSGVGTHTLTPPSSKMICISCICHNSTYLLCVCIQHSVALQYKYSVINTTHQFQLRVSKLKLCSACNCRHCICGNSLTVQRHKFTGTIVLLEFQLQIEFISCLAQVIKLNQQDACLYPGYSHRSNSIQLPWQCHWGCDLFFRWDSNPTQLQLVFPTAGIHRGFSVLTKAESTRNMASETMVLLVPRNTTIFPP